MTVGMFLAALAFIAAALVQIQIDVSVTHKNIQRATAMYTRSYEARLTHTYVRNAISLVGNTAYVPIKQRIPSEVHQHG